MASSKYIRMLSGRDRGELLEVESEMADHLIATRQAELHNFDSRDTQANSLPTTQVEVHKPWPAGETSGLASSESAPAGEASAPASPVASVKKRKK